MANPLNPARRARLERAEALLDQWLDLYEAALDNAKPDASKTSELSNVFSMVKRIYEIETARLNLDQLEEKLDAHNAQPLIDSELFGDGIPEDDD